MSPSPQIGRRRGRPIIRASATPRSGDAHVGRREVLKFGSTALQLLMASKAYARSSLGTTMRMKSASNSFFYISMSRDVSDGTVLCILAS